MRRHENKVKRHEPGPHGVISLVNRDEGYGFIATQAGDECTIDEGRSVPIGSLTAPRPLAARPRGSSPHASTVHIAGKHNRIERS